MKKEKRGGKRKSAGRKPIEDKKEVVTLYVRASKIAEKGGQDAIKKICYDALF